MAGVLLKDPSPFICIPFLFSFLSFSIIPAIAHSQAQAQKLNKAHLQPRDQNTTQLKKNGDHFQELLPNILPPYSVSIPIYRIRGGNNGKDIVITYSSRSSVHRDDDGSDISNSHTTSTIHVGDDHRENKSIKILSRRKALEFLEAHNSVRAALGQAPLRWNRTLAQYARSFAVRRKPTCEMLHSGGPYGENIFQGGSPITGWRPVVVSQLWADEQADYDLKSNTCAAGKICGHYTQMVWHDTQRLGCAFVKCSGGNGIFSQCNYDPPGNYEGEHPV